MDLRFSAEELAFRDELRAFIRDNLPTDIRDKMRLGYGAEKEDTIRWQRILNARNWAAKMSGLASESRMPSSPASSGRLGSSFKISASSCSRSLR